MSARGPVFGIPLGVGGGVIGVAVLVVAAMLVGMVRREQVPPLPEVDAPLAEMPAFGSVTAPPPAPPARGSAAEIAADAQQDVNAAFARMFEATGRTWRQAAQTLEPPVLRMLQEVDAPPGVAIRYGVAFANATDAQFQLDIRAYVSRYAADADAVRRDAMARALNRQAICLAGAYVGATYGARVFTPALVRRLLDTGLVNGERDRGQDAWFLRGSSTGAPARCRAFDLP